MYDAALIDEYLAGPQKLRDAIDGMTDDQIDASPIPGKWSTRQVICHIANFEPVYGDRMKHVIAEDRPTFAGGFHQQFAEHLAYDKRDIDEELRLIGVVRSGLVCYFPDLAAGTSEPRSSDTAVSPLRITDRATAIDPAHLKRAVIAIGTVVDPKLARHGLA